jgi:hypothetical protein
MIGVGETVGVVVGVAVGVADGVTEGVTVGVVVGVAVGVAVALGVGVGPPAAQKISIALIGVLPSSPYPPATQIRVVPSVSVGKLRRAVLNAGPSDQLSVSGS